MKPNEAVFYIGMTQLEETLLEKVRKTREAPPPPKKEEKEEGDELPYEDDDFVGEEMEG